MRIAALVAALALASATAAEAGVTGGVEATTDLRRRGLGWSGSRAAAGVWAAAEAGPASLTAAVTTLRGSRRHGGADAVVDVLPRYTIDAGAWRLSAGPSARLFLGAGGQDYIELDGSAGWTFGPLRLTAAASYAPRQRAIGGDNLYLSANAEAGIPGTPLTVLGGIGRTTGDARDAERARRLRPDGAYTDYRLAVEHVRNRLTFGAALTATSIGAPPPGRFVDRATGTRAAAYARFDL
ncbi:MAG: hypothetical protein PGN09_07260 [Sphingomonas fennica]